MWISVLAGWTWTFSSAPSVETTRCTAGWEITVVDADTGEGIPDARLEVDPPGAAPPRYAETDDEGHVHLRMLCPGRYRLAAAKDEHTSNAVDVDVVGAVTETFVDLEPLHQHHSVHVVVVHDEGPASTAAEEHLAGAALAQTRGEGLADALSGMAGVTTMRGTAGGMAKPVIRGQLGRRNLIIFDGVRHEGQKWGLDHAPEIDPYAAGRITVIKGAATTRFGPDAIGGVVLVDPRPLLRAPGLSGDVGVFGTSNALGGGLAARIDHAPRRVEGLAWRVEGNFGRHRAALSPDYPLDNTGAWTWNVGTRLGYLRERFDVQVAYRLLRSVVGICTCVTVSSEEDFEHAIESQRPTQADLYSAQFEIDRPKQEIWHHLAHAHARIELARSGELHALYAYQFNDRREFDVVRSDVTGPQIQLGLGTHTADLHYELSVLDLGAHWSLTGTFGTQLSRQVNAFEANTTLVPDYGQWGAGVFAVERLVHPRVELEVGARYQLTDRTATLEQRDYLGQRASGRLDEGRCERTDDGGGRCRHTFHAPSATLGVVAHPAKRVPGLSVRLQLDASARAPAIDEQFMNGAAPSFPVLGLGDSRLGIERTWGSTATLRFHGDWLLVEASGYANAIDDYIYFRPEGVSSTTRGPMLVFAFTPVDALIGGGEVRFDLATPGLPFEVSGNAAWVRGQDRSNGEPLALVPADRYELAGRYLWPDTRVSSHGYLELRGTFVDRNRHPSPFDFAPPPPAYVLLGVGAGVEFPTESTRMRLSLRGTNLLDTKYREYTSLMRYFADEPGWALQLRFAVDFDVSPVMAR